MQPLLTINQAQAGAFWADVAPKVETVLGFVPRDGLFGVLAAEMRGLRSQFETAREMALELAAGRTKSIHAPGAEQITNAFRKAQLELLIELDRYIKASNLILDAAVFRNNEPIGQAAVLAIQNYKSYRALVASMCLIPRHPATEL